MLRSVLKYWVGMCTVHKNNDHTTAKITWKVQLGLSTCYSRLLAALLIGKCVFLSTVYDSKCVCCIHHSNTSYCNAHGLHPQIWGMWFAKQPTAYQLSNHPGRVSLVHLFFQTWKVFCLLHIKFEMWQSTSNKYLPLSICTSTWHRKKMVNFRYKPQAKILLPTHVSAWL